MCTNISSTEVIQHIQLCHRLIPKSWHSDAIAVLCGESLQNKQQAESAVKCAVEAARIFPSSSPFQLTQTDIARVCATESQETMVLSCLKSIAAGTHSIHSSSSTFQLSNGTIYDLCVLTDKEKSEKRRSIAGSNPGECFVQVLSTLSSAHSSLQQEVPLRICKQPFHLQQASSQDYKFLLYCLQSLHRKLVTSQDVEHCQKERKTVSGFRLKKMWTEENDIEIVAGVRFSLLFEIYDQYNQLLTRAPHSAEVVPLLKISINENNNQGAVLWGNRLNATNEKGFLLYENLIISKPGKLEVSVSIPSSEEERIIQQHGKNNRKSSPRRSAHRVINSFFLTVKENPRFVHIRPCLYVFEDSFCPIDSSENDYNSLFPMTRHFLPSSFYMQNIHCFNESLQSMRVQSFLNVDGSMWVEYKLGIDSIWTNIGLPSLEMAPTERLQLILPEREDGEDSRKIIKLIKRAYYRSSLQWHPDRWAGYDPYYQAAIQAIFPLINDAYEKLMSEFTNTSNPPISQNETN
jgi:hypothetical protein